MELRMGEVTSYRSRAQRHLNPLSRIRIDRLRQDREAFAMVRRVAEARSVSLRALMMGGQSRGHVGLSRRMAMYLVHTQLGRTQIEVGVLFGRTHGTVSYACKTIELLRDDPVFDLALATIEADHRAAAGKLRHAA